MSPPRPFVEGLSVHVIQRGNNRCRIFGDDADRERFLLKLAAACQRRNVAVHGYVLMDTHFHFLATPPARLSLGKAMQELGVQYVRSFNRKYDRIGTLWSHRPRMILLEDQQRCIRCLRYIEQNPLRAAMVAHPVDYRWSSYAANAMGIPCAWLTPHPSYLALGRSDAERQTSYRVLCRDVLSAADLAELRD